MMWTTEKELAAMIELSVQRDSSAFDAGVQIDHMRCERQDLIQVSSDRQYDAWPDPPGDLLTDPMFEAIWQTIKTWDINVPAAYGGYCGATGNHVYAIYRALTAFGQAQDTPPPDRRPDGTLVPQPRPWAPPKPSGDTRRIGG